MCKIIVMANQKGGVAKTSSTRNLTYSLAELGKKVLAVDFDPQTNLTISFGVAPAVLQETAASLMMKLVMDEALPEKGSYILNICGGKGWGAERLCTIREYITKLFGHLRIGEA